MNTLLRDEELQMDAKRALLAERLRKAAEGPPAIPLSFAQQRLWFIDQLEPNSSLYNVPTVVRLSGRLNPDALQRALDLVVARHETLRTRIVCNEGNPGQVVDENARVRIVFHDLTHLPEAEREAEARSRVRAEVNQPFKLSAAPLARATLLRLQPEEHWFVLNIHHIVSDEWSLKVCFQELTDAYQACCRGEAPNLPELPIQYGDYALWQRDWVQGELLEEQLAYWSRQLQGNPAVLELPTDHPRPSLPTFNGRTLSRSLRPELAARLHELAKQNDATLFMLLLAAFKTLLHRYTQLDDVVVGSPIAGRNQVETERLIGFFVNTLVLRTDLSGNPTFIELLRRVRETTLGAYAHQDLPFEKIVEKLHPERTLTHMPFAHVMFAVQNGIPEKLEWPELSLRFAQPESDTAKFDVTFVVQPTESGLVAQAEYNRDLFEANTIARFLQHFETLLEGIVAQPGRRLSELPLLGDVERRQLLEDWNATAKPYPADKCIHELFEAQAARTPSAMAVKFGHRSVTYGELNERANRLARYLRRNSVGPDVLVAICMERSVEMIVAMLAVLKAGGAYVPIDPSYPKSRLAFMLSDAQAPVLLTQQRLLARLPRTPVVVSLDSDWELIASSRKENLPSLTRPEHLAYVIYTSGSTGEPKGVAVPHRAVNRLVLNTDYIQVTSADNVAQVSNASFDAATFEIWGALLNGARVVGIETDVALSPKDFARRLRDERISALFLTTALFNQVASEAPGAFRTVRTVMFGGEACDPKWIRSVLDHQPPERLLHVYGPTENTTFSTWHLIREVPANAATVPIGKPIANSQCYVLDRQMNPVPVGVPGNLYVAGDGLARGYWNREERTAQKFVTVERGHLCPAEGASKAADQDLRAPVRLYGTGDLARWRADGTLEFIGRTDHQVKIRGFRIELGEIETVLNRHAAVRECVVTVKEQQAGNKRLVAYYVPEGRRIPTSGELRRFLQEKLPDYMTPTMFVQLESLPLTPNGKVDRGALPDPDNAKPKPEKGYATPRDAVEVKLTEIWEQVLGVHPIGIEDKFFELGGHSLLAVRVIAQIEKVFGRKLRVATIFQAPTIEQLAAILREEIQEGSAIAGTSLVDIQSQGTRPPIFFVHGAGGGMFWGYVNLSRCLGSGQPVYGLKSRGLDGRDEHGTIEEMAAHYVNELKAIQPRGPYHLGGYCFGGNVAYEMARQLHAQGEEVALLALLNAAPHNSRYMRVSWTPRWAFRFVKNIFYWLNYFRHWTPNHRRDYFRWKRDMWKRRLSALFGRRPACPGKRVNAGDMVDLSSYSPEQRRLWETHINALVNYHPQPFAGRVHLFRSPGHPLVCSFAEDYGWGDYAKGGVIVNIVPGVHEKILEEPCVQSVARQMKQFLSPAPEAAADPAANGAAREPASASNGSAAHNLTPPRRGGAGARETESLELPVVGNSAPQPFPPSRRSGIGGEGNALPPAAEPGDERRQTLRQWNRTAKEFPLDRTYAQLFEEQVSRAPNAVAVRFEGEQLTFAELNAQANQLAAYLQSLGVKSEVLVGVCLERSLQLPVALLAILKSGGAYLPLDRSYPRERLAYMLEDSRARVLLTDSRFPLQASGAGPQVVRLDDPAQQQRIHACSPGNPKADATPSSLAYVIYTSGSTGRPKGVEITQRSLLNHNFACALAYELTPEDRVLQFSPFSFDISVEEVFPTWLKGGALVLRNDNVLSSTGRFMEFVAGERLTVLNIPTAYWHEVVEYLQANPLPPSVRLVIIGGEKASDEAWRRWKSRVGTSVKLINSYGPTEATVTATMHLAQAEDETLPIGRPIANSQALILDGDLRPVAPGESGELHIGGIGLARGYLNRPELTAQKFIANPFREIPSERLYRTGDVARYRADGAIEFVGRVDEQVKIRGFRIELGEIEAALRSHPELKEAVVVAREDVPGRKRLVGYYVARGEKSPRIGELLQFLKGKLPAYMVPGAFVRLDAMPLTPAGKVDRRSLPPPADTRPELDEQFVAPRTPVEEAIASVWREVLGLDRVGVQDNFFDLGGHSLLAIQVISRVRDTLKVEVTLADVFAYPTIGAMAEHLAENGGSIQPLVPVTATTRGEQLPLNPSQWRAWFLDLFEPGQANYNIPTVIRLEGELDFKALEQSLTELTRRHEALRAVFPIEDGQSIQLICEPKDVYVPVIDLTHLPAAQRENEAMQIAAREGAKPYVMSRPVLRPRLLRLGASEHWLLLITHRVACDSRSVRLMIEELVAIYEAITAGRPVSLPPTPMRYADAMAGLQLPEDQEQRQLNYWTQRLKGAPALLELPTDRPRPARQSDDGARRPVNVSTDTTRALEKLCEAEECTPFEFLLAVFQTLLFRYTGNPDIVVGSTVPIGSRDPLERMIGKFDNLVALRSDLSGDPTFRELLARVRETNRGALAHSGLLFERVLSELLPERNASYTPIFQVMFDYYEKPLPVREASGLRFTPIEVHNQTSKLDLQLNLTRVENGLCGFVEYNRVLFDADRMSRLVEHFCTLLNAVAENPDQRVAVLPLMPEHERRQVLIDWNATGRPYPANVSLTQLFEEQVRRTPDATALVAGTDRLSYVELNARANQLAHHLRSLGVKPGVLVGLCLERNWRLPVGILGVLKAGGAYVPMDPSYPKDRLAYMLADAQAPVLVTQQGIQAVVPPAGTRVVNLDSDWPRIRTCAPDNLKDSAAGNDLAYVIYTSGSTGQPKGVALEHRNAVAFVHWAREVFTDAELSGVLASTSICFDLSIFELFVPLSWGGKVILAENALGLPGLPAAKEVTLVNTVPSAIRELLRIKGVPESVRVVNLAGEPLVTPLVNRICAETRVEKVYDLYGPTETTTYSTFTLRRPEEPATIGRPLANEQVYLLDANREPVPIGVPGEIYIGGAGVARGYLNKPELTAERFVENLAGPHIPDSEPRGTAALRSERLYRTGDLARWRADGNLEFLGRIDHQVKIRGFRIELGEVEAVLRKHPDVRDGIVIARDDEGSGDKRLVAYLVPKPGAKLATEELRGYMRKHLPQYMVPGALVFLDALPLTPNGKVNRKALPAPDTDRRDTSIAFVAPRTPVETQLAAIWQEVLGVERVGIHDNFFELGGHSLLAIQVISRVRETCKVELPLFSLFEACTIELLAKGLASGEWTQNQLPVLPLQPVPRDGALPVSFVQERLWFLDQLEPGNHAYNVPAALRLVGKLNLSALQRAFDEIVRRHEALRTRLVYADGALTQEIAAPAPVRLVRIDFAGAPASEREQRLRHWINTEAQRPFNLSAGPLMRIGLVRMSDEDHALLVVIHHTVSDGWSLALLFQELEQLYGAFAAGKEAPQLPPLPVQYADFAVWKRRCLDGALLEKELAFWKDRLRGAPPSLELPADHPDPVEPSRKGATRTITFGGDTVEALMRLSQQQGATPFMVLITALGITLEKWTQQKDMVLGTVVAGRNCREVENVIGCFMNFLPIRLQVRPSETARQLLSQVKSTVLEAQAHQDCPFEKIVEAINPERGQNRNPLYNVALLLQNFPEEMFRHPELRVSRMPVEMQAALLDLRFEAELADEKLSLMCEFRTDLFVADTIEHLLASLREVIERLVSRPETPLSEFAIVRELEARAQQGVPEADYTIAVASTFTAEPVQDSLQYWAGELEISAKVEFAPFNQVFQQLLDPASLLAVNSRGANVLLVRVEDWQERKAPAARNGNGASPAKEPELGAPEPGRIAGEFISAVRSAASRSSRPMLVFLCPASSAALASPDRRALLERIEKQVADELEPLGGVQVVTSAELLETYPVAEYHDAAGDELGRVPYTPVFFTALGTMIARKLQGLRQPPRKVVVLDCDNTLWSGVCGEDGAAGICLDAPRKALQEFMRAQRDAGRLLAVCSKNNEEDVREVFARRLDMPLRQDDFAAWRTNWLPKSENLKSIARELNLGLDSFVFVDDNPVECADVEANCPGALVLQLPERAEDIPQFLKHCWIFDRFKVTAEDRRRSEMYRENRERESLRAQSMSLADFLQSLQLEIRLEPMTPSQLPRVSQLTLRTNQFNCTTIRRPETELQQRAQSADVLTVSVTDRFGDYGLVGVAISEPKRESLDVETFLLSCRVLGRGVEHRVLARLGEKALQQKLRFVDVHFNPSARNKPAADFLQSVGSQFRQPQNGGFIYRFPAEYAAEIVFTPPAEEAAASVAPAGQPNAARGTSPAPFRRCRAIALSSNDAAKIHQAVEAQKSPARSAKHAEYLAARSELEKQLCALWEKLLRVDRVGINDNFFDLGGHSLLAVRLFVEVEKLTGRKLPLVTVFQAPTVEQLARVLEEAGGARSQSPIVPVQAGGPRPPLFLVHGAGGDVLWGYANLAKHLHPDQPVYGIKSRGRLGLEEFDNIEDMAAYYLQEVRAVQPHGPYYLGGYCFGGNVAYEMARQLREHGEEVAFVGLIDASPSAAGYERMRWRQPAFAFRFARNLWYWIDDFMELDVREQGRFVARKLRTIGRKLARRIPGRNGSHDVDLEEVIDLRHFPEQELRFWQIHLNALVRHQEKPYEGPVTLIRTRGQPLFCSLAEDFCWNKLVRNGVIVKRVPGSHENIFVDPHVKVLAEVMESSLAEARGAMAAEAGR